MAVQFDNIGRPVTDAASVATTLGVANPGGGIGVRVIIDDTVVTSEMDTWLALRAINNEIRKRNWPVT